MTRSLLVLTLAAALLAGGLSVPSPAAGPAREGSGIHKVVFLSDTGPVVIGLHVRLDGRPVSEAWEAFVRQVFEYLDRDRDGSVTAAEAAAAPPPAALGANAIFVGGTDVRIPKLDSNGDGKVSRTELGEYYRSSGLPPFTIGFTGRDSGIIRFSAAGLPDRQNSPQVVNARVFTLLDRDGDGKLSRDELLAAPRIFAAADRDEDEMVTSGELLGQASNGGDSYGAVAFLETSASMAPASSGVFHLVAEKGPDVRLARQLLSRYAKKGTAHLTARRLGLGEKAMVALDRNGDGKLNEEELARLGSLPAETELTVRLGKRERDERFLTVNRAGKRRISTHANSAGSDVTLEIGNVRIDLRGPAGAEGVFQFDVKNQYSAQFRAADADNNGYLDKAESDRAPFFRRLFVAADRDGDGKVFEKELLAYLDKMERFRNLAERSSLTLTVKDAGKGLFEMIDADGDGRLGVRELRRMAGLLGKLDQDGDGKLSAHEVPRHYRGTFDPGSSAGGGGGRAVVVFRGMGGDGPRRPEPTKGPLWFRKTDRNRDGDVSRKEWLGTEVAFRQIDADGDGLISSDEAERYDRAQRRAKE